MEDGELTESVGSLLQGASTHDMDHLDLSYPGLVADDAWHDIPATYTGLDTTPPTQPASYSGEWAVHIHLTMRHHNGGHRHGVFCKSIALLQKA